MFDKPVDCSKRILFSSQIMEDVAPNDVADHFKLLYISEMHTGLWDQTLTSGVVGNENVSFPSIIVFLWHTYVFCSHDKYT